MLYDGVALVPLLDVFGHFPRFLFRREGFPIEGQVRPANMVVNVVDPVLHNIQHPSGRNGFHLAIHRRLRKTS